MRLIDADELRKKLLMIDCMEDAVEIVDNQPTFDLDKIKAEGRKEVLKEVSSAIYHECFEVSHKDDGLWDGGNWFRYKLFENVIESLKEQKDGR